jgi:hypothetical protein
MAAFYPMLAAEIDRLTLTDFNEDDYQEDLQDLVEDDLSGKSRDD